VLLAVSYDLFRQTGSDSGELLEVIRGGFVDVDCRRRGIGGLSLLLKGKHPTIAKRSPQHDHQREYATEVPEQFPNLALTHPIRLGQTIVTSSNPIFRPFVEFSHSLTSHEKVNPIGKKIPLRVKGSLPAKLIARLTDHRVALQRKSYRLVRITVGWQSAQVQ
jgi:hypothetical protein